VRVWCIMYCWGMVRDVMLLQLHAAGAADHGLLHRHHSHIFMLLPIPLLPTSSCLLRLPWLAHTTYLPPTVRLACAES
jgi:hypothetical protein